MGATVGLVATVGRTSDTNRLWFFLTDETEHAVQQDPHIETLAAKPKRLRPPRVCVRCKGVGVQVGTIDALLTPLAISRC